jgi:hypothetical protein
MTLSLLIILCRFCSFYFICLATLLILGELNINADGCASVQALRHDIFGTAQQGVHCTYTVKPILMKESR